MKVLYDDQIFSVQKFGGISRYFAELVKNSRGLFEASVALRFSENFYLNSLGIAKKFPVSRNFKGKNRIINHLNKKALQKTKLQNADIFHPTYYDPSFLSHIKKTPFVLTVYDMIHEIFPELLRDGFTIQNKKRLIFAAKKIIAISQSTKNDILRFYPKIDPEKIEVVYLGNSLLCDAKKNAQKENFILFTGERGGYKNFANFVRAVAPILKENNARLVCTGRPFEKWELCLFEQLEIERLVECRFASDAELSHLYSTARLFVFPSLYEGFGIPILEAFSSFCPVALSCASCFPEIAGDAALYFDPQSISDMKEKIQNLYLSSSMQTDFAKKGEARLSMFSWEKCAKETAKVYERAMEF